jgi:putative membrane-bound dehydrogenase-like protein
MRILLFLLGLTVALSAAEWNPILIPQQPSKGPLEPQTLRCYIRVPDAFVVPQEKDLFRDSVTLSFGQVSGPLTVLVNGQKVLESEAVSLPARRVKVPKGILERGVYNAVVVRMEKGGLLEAAPILAGYFDEVVLAGKWQQTSGKPEDFDLKALPAAPAVGAFAEKDFRKSVTPLSVTENMPGQRLTPAESLARMRVGPGLIVEQMLREPLVAQPTHLSFDERGRLWVSQYRQYPYPAGIKQISRDMYYRAVFDRVPPPPPNHDRGADIISVHEDTDGDGIFDKHKVVLDGLNMANAAVYGHGGIWVMQTPYLLFYPDANGDDVPDGPVQVRLAGFGLEDAHSVANGLIWGPDGWLYGGQGSTTTSRVTRPGTDPTGAPGVYFEGCMVWRYQPERRIYEIFAEGGGNTFGLEFDAEGQLFSGHNGGETHGWHFVQSGIYLKQGKDPGKFGATGNDYSFGEFSMMKSANPIARFTHEIIVVDGTAMPASLRGQFLGADPLHRNLVSAARIADGPTFTTKDTGKPLEGDDIAFRPVYLTNAPDGSVYVADFYEEYIAHGQNYQGQLDPTTGRIYRLRGKDLPLEKDVNLSKKTTKELVALLQHPNRWQRMTAVRLLGERRDPEAILPLKYLLAGDATHPALEAVWALFQMGALDGDKLVPAFHHASPVVRAWAIRLAGDSGQMSERLLSEVQFVLRKNPIEGEPKIAPLVLQQAASTARRLPVSQAVPIVRRLIAIDEAAEDAFVPLLCWWTLESHLSRDGADTTKAGQAGDNEVYKLFSDPGIWHHKMVQQHLANRLGQRLTGMGRQSDWRHLAAFLSIAAPNDLAPLLAGFETALKGRSLPPLPPKLQLALAERGLGSQMLRLRQGDAGVLAEAVKSIQDEKATLEERLPLVRALGEMTAPTALDPLLTVAQNSASSDLRKAALTALLSFSEPRVGEQIAAGFVQQPAAVKPAAITLLASRDASRPLLLALVEKHQLTAMDIPPDAATWLRAQPASRDLAAKLLPAPPAAPDRKRIAEVQEILKKGQGNPYAGEAIFLQRCASCHQLFQKGGKIGPNLTAYQRDDLGTMLTSIILPNAEIREGFENYTATTKDGRTLGGFLADKDPNVVVLRGFDGQDISIARDQIVELKAAGRSLMPEGLLEGLTEQQLWDLFAYLRIPQPITK